MVRRVARALVCTGGAMIDTRRRGRWRADARSWAGAALRAQYDAGDDPNDPARNQQPGGGNPFGGGFPGGFNFFGGGGGGGGFQFHF